jgi:hypothetical protein
MKGVRARGLTPFLLVLLVAGVSYDVGRCRLVDKHLKFLD